MKNKNHKSFCSKKQISNYVKNIPSNLEPDYYYRIYLRMFEIIDKSNNKIYFHRIFTIKLKSICRDKNIFKKINTFFNYYNYQLNKPSLEDELKEVQRIISTYSSKIEKYTSKIDCAKKQTFSYTPTSVTREQIAQQNKKYLKRIYNTNKSRPSSLFKIIYTGMTN
jgi:hypothetical protein